MPPKRYVGGGASAAGMAAAQVIREVDPTGALTVLSAEGDRPYFRPLIPFIVDGKKTEAEVALLGQGPYTAAGVEVRLSATATAVDPAARTVTVNGAEVVPYDKLLVATGSRPVVPPDIRGADTPGVFALRTLAEARALAERAGLRILTGRNVVEVIAGANGVAGVLLDSGEELPCQIVCIGKGVRPNVEFLTGSGVRVERGVVVNERTACSVPEVHAAGDVAVTFDSITGAPMMTALWTNAVEMGLCAGRNMAGRPTAYAGIFAILNATQVAEVPFVSMGIVHTAGTDYETHVAHTATTYSKVVFAAADGVEQRLHYGHLLRL